MENVLIGITTSLGGVGLSLTLLLRNYIYHCYGFTPCMQCSYICGDLDTYTSIHNFFLFISTYIGQKYFFFHVSWTYVSCLVNYNNKLAFLRFCSVKRFIYLEQNNIYLQWMRMNTYQILSSDNIQERNYWIHPKYNNTMSY